MLKCLVLRRIRLKTGRKRGSFLNQFTSLKKHICTKSLILRIGSKGRLMQKAFDLVKNLNGKWYRNYGLAFCPAHENTKTPSLSISESPDGKLLLTCFAGCTFEAITRACRSRGLMESQRLSRNSFIAENIKNYKHKLDCKENLDAVQEY